MRVLHAVHRRVLRPDVATTGDDQFRTGNLERRSGCSRLSDTVEGAISHPPAPGGFFKRGQRNRASLTARHQRSRGLGFRPLVPLGNRCFRITLRSLVYITSTSVHPILVSGIRVRTVVVIITQVACEKKRQMCSLSGWEQVGFSLPVWVGGRCEGQVIRHYQHYANARRAPAPKNAPVRRFPDWKGRPSYARRLHWR